MGRTGRKRNGKICILLTEGKEELNFKSAMDEYVKVQNAVNAGKVKLYSPNPILMNKNECFCIMKKFETGPAFIKANSEKTKSVSSDILTRDEYEVYLTSLINEEAHLKSDILPWQMKPSPVYKIKHGILSVR